MTAASTTDSTYKAMNCRSPVVICSSWLLREIAEVYEPGSEHLELQMMASPSAPFKDPANGETRLVI